MIFAYYYLLSSTIKINGGILPSHYFNYQIIIKKLHIFKVTLTIHKSFRILHFHFEKLITKGCTRKRNRRISGMIKKMGKYLVILNFILTILHPYHYQQLINTKMFLFQNMKMRLKKLYKKIV